MVPMRDQQTADDDKIDGRLISTLYEGEADLLTLHPAEPTEDEKLSAWITAKGEAYVSLMAYR